MSEKNSHSAAGQMAGYLFQPERALYRLATSSRGDQVGIETLDDIAVLSADGTVKVEQTKHYISDSNLTGRGRDFWKTLNIWLTAIDNEDIDPAKTHFFLVTNKQLPSGIVLDLKNLPDDHQKRVEWIAKLRVAGQNPSATIKEFVDSVLGHSDDELMTLVKALRVIDGSDASHGESLRKEIAGRLMLPKEHEDEMIQSLSGWLHETTLKLIRSGQSALFSRESFEEQVRRIIYVYQDKKFIRETEEAYLPVSDEERAACKGRLFVKQLQWLGFADDGEEILDAIDDHIRCSTEVIRLSQKGVVAPRDFEAFDARLIRRWKNLKRQHTPSPMPSTEKGKQDIGATILHETLNHREPLASQPTSEFYLTSGAYHRLADDPPSVGWHPEYQAKCESLNGKAGENEIVD